MQLTRAWVVVGSLTLGACLGACKDDGMRMQRGSVDSQEAAGGSEAPPVSAAPTPGASPEPSPAGDATGSTAAASSPSVLTTAETSKYGTYLADQQGRALYLLEGEPEGQSNCYDQCAEVWPPLLAEQGVQAGAEAVQAAKIGTLERRDGSTQVTYGGKPLYYYAKDPGPGQVTGQDVTDEWGEWYLVAPDGDALESSEGEAHEGGGGGSSY